MLKQDKDTTKTVDDEIKNDDENNAEVEYDDVGFPVDTGWAWVVLAGATLQVFLYGGLLKSYGIFFVEYQKHFESSASETNIMQTTHFIVASISGVLVPNLGLKYISHRTAVVIGGIGIFIAYLISAFATDIFVLTLTLGVIAGTCQMMMHLPLIASIGIHFRKYRGLANSIHVSGSSIGSLVFGPLYTTLFEYYGYSGTMMLVSAIMLNSVISGSLLRPLHLYLSTRRKAKGPMKNKYSHASSDKIKDSNLSMSVQTPLILANIDANGCMNSTGSSNQQSCNENFANLAAAKDDDVTSLKGSHEKHYKQTLSPLVGRPYLINRSASYDPEKLKDVTHRSPVLAKFLSNRRNRARTVSEISHSSAISNVLHSLSRSKVALYASTEVMSEFASLGQLNATELSSRNGIECNHKVEDPKSKKNKTYLQNTLKVLQTVFNVSVFNSVFIHYLCMSGIAMPGPIMMNVYLIPYAKGVGATTRDVSVIFIVTSTVDLLCRVLTGIMADRKWLKPTTIVGISCVVLGILCQIIRLFRSSWSLILVAVIQGAFNGPYMCLYNVILIEYMGLEVFKHCIGWTAMCHGVTTALSFQLTGLLRDISGNFLYTYHFIGAQLLFGGLLAFLLPVTSSLAMKQKPLK